MNIKKIIAGLTLSILLASGVAVADYNSALSVYYSGDFKTAFKRILPYAKEGNKSAQYWIASMYQNGDGVKQDPSLAVKWYVKAAKQGDIGAQYALADMYASGIGGPPNYDQSVKLFTQAAEKGSRMAQYRLGTMYRLGEGAEQNNEIARKWLTMAAENGSQSAQRDLDAMGQSLSEGSSDYDMALSAYYSEDYETAYKLMLPLAKGGDARAQYQVGSMFVHGDWVSENKETAIKWFSLSAKAGNVDAQSILGLMFVNGHKLPKNNEIEQQELAKSSEERSVTASESFDQMSSMPNQELCKRASKNGRWSPYVGDAKYVKEALQRNAHCSIPISDRKNFSIYQSSLLCAIAWADGKWDSRLKDVVAAAYDRKLDCGELLNSSEEVGMPDKVSTVIVCNDIINRNAESRYRFANPIYFVYTADGEVLKVSGHDRIRKSSSKYKKGTMYSDNFDTYITHVDFEEDGEMLKLTYKKNVKMDTGKNISFQHEMRVGKQGLALKYYIRPVGYKSLFGTGQCTSKVFNE
jgi:TPR repeat protein